MKYDIVHKGRVVEIAGGMVNVAVIPDSACGACKARQICGTEEEGGRIISVWDEASERFAVGEEVIVGMARVMGMRAVFYAYMLPFLTMLTSLVVCTSLGLDDLGAGLITLGSVALYYTALYLFRGKLEREIIFKISKLQ